MELGEVLDKLGYAGSENYLDENKVKLGRVVDYGHLFRKAAKDPCQLKGVYTLRETAKTTIPLVYICESKTEKDAKNIHRLVWNQDAVPFLIVNSPANVRVYPGFCYKVSQKAGTGVDKVLNTFSEADNLKQIAEALHASAIDNGKVWDSPLGRSIKPEYRVDYTLLGNLKKLDLWLLKKGLDLTNSHALIGKYVYLHYLRDREILSARKLQKWGIDSRNVFGRDATKEGLEGLVAKLDVWPNGNVFPIDFSRVSDEHIRRVAGTFNGDELAGEKEWQLHLDFKAYDFSYIPIEVLSIVYEQFLHAEKDEGKKGKKSKGSEASAYYTPIPVVNLMLSELEERRPLKRGMRVFDPSCGSGAFLVQAFRRLIEKEFCPTSEGVSMVELQKLVEEHFFGVDTDLDACRVARFNLILTMLDYVHPPDLAIENQPGSRPKLPRLDHNIFHGNFFQDTEEWRKVFAYKKADWVVGNPPWKLLKESNKREEDKPIETWIDNEKKNRPIGNRQIARAFAWRSAEYVSGDGEIALFLPAMSLFEEAAQAFRAAFFRKMKVHTIANFSNLRRVISGGRFKAPAAAFFYRPRSQNEECEEDESIRSYSPLLANQESSRSNGKEESWSIVVNASEIRDIPLERVIGGEGLPWKIAAWGSDLDVRLLNQLRKRFQTIGQMESGLIEMSEGLQLRNEESDEEVELVPKNLNAKQIDIKIMRGLKSFFAFPDKAISEIASDLTHARKGRVNKPLRVCRPPHVIVSAARTFAVYSDDFIIVPPRQIGIVSLSEDRDFLKAMSLFLSSDFAFYYDYFTSTEFGIGRDRSTLEALRSMPFPLNEIRKEIRKWVELHKELFAATNAKFRNEGLFLDEHKEHLEAGPVVEGELIEKLNDLVYKSLGLGAEEQSLIHDLVRVRLGLNDGRLDKCAIKGPNAKDLEVYGKQLQAELDEFIRGEFSGGHEIEILHDDSSGMVRIKLVKDGEGPKGVKVFLAGKAESKALEACRNNIREEKSQWVYFDRNLRVYQGPYTYIMKPMQRFHWTQTQARLDAREIIAESISRRKET